MVPDLWMMQVTPVCDDASHRHFYVVVAMPTFVG